MIHSCLSEHTVVEEQTTELATIRILTAYYREQAPFEVLIMNFRTQPMDATSFIHSVRSLVGRIIVISGGVKTEQEALRAGADHWLLKPDILRDIQALLNSDSALRKP